MSTKEEVSDWAKADLQAMREKLGELDWEEEFGEFPSLGGQGTSPCGRQATS